jgi:hypothetical protein
VADQHAQHAARRSYEALVHRRVRQLAHRVRVVALALAAVGREAREAGQLVGDARHRRHPGSRSLGGMLTVDNGRS